MSSTSPEQLLLRGCETDDAALVARALDQDPSLTTQALEDALIASAPSVTTLLIDRGAPISHLPPKLVATANSQDILAALVRAGWDINKRLKREPTGQPLLWHICANPRLVHWSLSHGARVTPAEQDPADLEDAIACPPLLDRAVQDGSLATVALLRSAGAPLGRRTLHWACAAAGSARQAAGTEARRERLEVVRFLVEEVGVDVNAMDVEPGVRLPNFYGTPLGYVAHRAAEPAEVARYLMGQGADPHISDCWGHDPCVTGSRQFKGVVEEYESQRKAKE